MVDTISLEVIRNRLAAIADEMEITLLRSAYSPIVKEGLDASAAIFDTKGQTVAQAAAIPIHLGALIPAVATILEKFPLSTMAEGDAYILNDPYHGGTHLPDLVVVQPVFFEGGPVAVCCSMCHHQEMGGKTPGSSPPDATELFQEGFIIPPLKLIDKGTPVDPIFALLAANVRIPDVVLGDLRAQLAANYVGGERMKVLMGEYGAPVVQEAMDNLLDRAERLTREALAKIPAGTYRFTDYLDDDGISVGKRVKIQAAVTLAGREVTVDFTGTDPQLRGPFNCVPSSTMSAVYYVVRTMTGPDIPNNSGCYRPIRIIAPEGTLVNPLPPAPVNSRTATVKRITDALFGAMVQALPGQVPAISCGQLLIMHFGGQRDDGRRFVTSELGAGGMGGRPGKDGLDVIETDATNCMNIPAEAMEMDAPIRVVKWGLWEGSQGAGQYRGGLGMTKTFEILADEVVATYRGERHTTQPWGLYGGAAARSSCSRIIRRDGTVEEVRSKQTLFLSRGDRVEVNISGGGGYGDPLDREADMVLEDVWDQRVTPEEAGQLYGVVLSPALDRVDREATEERRSELRAARGPVGWTFDRGEFLGRA